jgi:hypothetical protein
MGFTRAVITKRLADMKHAEEADMLQAHIRNGVPARQLQDELILKM